MLISLVRPSENIRKFFLDNVYKINERKDYETYIDMMVYDKDYGLIAGIYGQLLEDTLEVPKNYNKKEIEKLLNVNVNTDKIFGTPNIIVLFGESFWDIDLLSEITFDKKITSNFQKLKEKGIFFDMISPSYGGVSANVEFEFLTGASLNYFNNGYIPYLQLYKNKNAYNFPSIIQELKNNGYKTKITAYTSNKLFNCGKVYKFLGVDEAKFYDNVDKKYKKAGVASDDYVVQNIIEEFKNKDSKKIFSMSLTMQAHMPYLKNKYDSYDINIVDTNLSEEENNALLSYAQGIYDTDKALYKLYDFIQTLDEPTLIIFYGDHLPYLRTIHGINVLKKLDYFNTNDQKLNSYRLYNTQALILANYDIKEDEYTVLSPDLLSTYVLNKMDINLSNYYKWLYTLIDKYPASNKIISMTKSKELYYTSDLPNTLKEIYETRKKVQYKYFIDKKSLK